MHTNKPEIDSMQQQINELTAKVEELEEQIQSISVPIIPSIMPNTILVPFVGDLYPERFDTIIPQILSHVGKKQTDWVILDFTAISANETPDLSIMSHHLESITSSLHLMGAEVLLVGLNPHLTREIVSAGLPFIKELNCFLDFKTALEYLMKRNGLKFTRIEE